MLWLIIVLAAFFFFGLARTLLRRRGWSPTAIVPSCSWRKTKTSALRQSRRHESFSQQHLGKVLEYLSQLYGIPLHAGERFFVTTGLSPYCHLCVDDFIPMPCPACEWSRSNFCLIGWRREALLELADKLEVQRSMSQMLLNLAPPQGRRCGSATIESAP